MNAPKIVLHHPTDMLIDVANYKSLDYSIADERNTLPDVEGVALTFGPEIIIGECHIIGWIDRRYPYPPLYPSSPEEYSRIATVQYALSTNQICPKVMLRSKHTDKPFLFFHYPTIADLTLARKLRGESCPVTQAYVDSVFNFSSESGDAF